MARLTWPELRRYWEGHSARVRVDADEDPDQLANVCYPGRPHWYNARAAELQEQVFDRLLERIAGGPPEGRALDVGCGAGRWCRRLAASGYAVTGIDLQPSLLTIARERYPDLAFEQAAIQEYRPDARFDLVTSVTVLQHLPAEEQVRAFTSIQELARPGAHVLLLENVAADSSAYVFPRSIDGWCTLAESRGFRTVAVVPYDHSPALRAVEAVVLAAQRRRRNEDDPALYPESGAGARRRAADLARRGALGMDRLLEPLAARAPVLPSRHAGFLFRRP